MEEEGEFEVGSRYPEAAWKVTGRWASVASHGRVVLGGFR